nr:hypothetical protein [uncultured Treponema sp.]
MLLIGVKKEDGWLRSQWNLTYPTGWDNICRGISKIIKVPLMMTIFNQTPIVNVSLPSLGEEFENADYEKFNKSLCTYMDSIELYMHGLGK